MASRRMSVQNFNKINNISSFTNSNNYSIFSNQTLNNNTLSTNSKNNRIIPNSNNLINLPIQNKENNKIDNDNKENNKIERDKTIENKKFINFKEKVKTNFKEKLKTITDIEFIFENLENYLLNKKSLDAKVVQIISNYPEVHKFIKQNKPNYNDIHKNKLIQKFNNEDKTKFFQFENNKCEHEAHKILENLKNERKNNVNNNSILQQIDSDEKIKNLEEDLKPIWILGKGGFSTVYEVFSISKRELFALKVLNKNQPEKYVKREIRANEILTNEIKKNNKYNETYILKLEKIIKNSKKDITSFVLEKADTSLTNFVYLSKGLSEIQAFFFFRQILFGIEEMHNLKIIHRDLKPDNILLKNKDVKICDFTTAKFLLDKECLDTQIGTHGFKPSNICKNFVPDDKKYLLDIYALGIILYFMVFADYCFKEDSEFYDDLKSEERGISKEFKNFFEELTKDNLDEVVTIKKIKQHEWYISCQENFEKRLKDNNLVNESNDKKYLFMKN